MKWSSIRDFLDIPMDLTGKGVAIAVIDGKFQLHPDICSNASRDTYIVKTYQENPIPSKVYPPTSISNEGLHGLWTASAAAGSGALCNGEYSGVASEADLYLIEMGSSELIEDNMEQALLWVKEHAHAYNIKGIVITLVGQKHTGLLPWQADPLRILCEQIVHQGLLVVVSAGNNHEVTCGSIISPSALAVGGVVVPLSGLKKDVSSFLSSNGRTFDDKIIPDVLAPAENVVLPFPFLNQEERENHFTLLNDNLPTDYARQWGTSYAAPIVLGMAACLWQKYPLWTAEEVKEAIVNSAEIHPSWINVESKLVSNQAFKLRCSLLHKNEKSAYQRWVELKTLPLSARVDMLSSKSHILDVLLSFLPDELPNDVIPILKELLRHPLYKIRTAAITVLSIKPPALCIDDIERCLIDHDPHVRMGGLNALSKCPQYWDKVVSIFSVLINDGNTDVRYNACKLAIDMKSKSLLVPLIEGLEFDAKSKRISTFGQRCFALENITGHYIHRDPEWQEGEDPYSERSISALSKMAVKWNDFVEEMSASSMDV